MDHPSPQLPVQIDQILVVAPSHELQASLRFLLEEEDYTVTLAASIDEAPVRLGGFACAVVDHHALKSRPAAEVAAFMSSHWPVVLLANGTPGVELPESFRVVTKPGLGAPLSQAVREAVAMAGSISPPAIG